MSASNFRSYASAIFAGILAGSAVAQEAVRNILVSEPAAGGVQEKPKQAIPKSVDLAVAIDVYLNLTPDQKSKVDPIVKVHQAKVAAILADSSLSARKKDNRVTDERKALVTAIKPFLTGPQIHKLFTLLDHIRPDGTITRHVKIPFVQLLSLGYDIYYPSDATARSIFGDASGSIRVGFGDFDSATNRRFSFGFALDSLGMGRNENKLFVLSPQMSLQYRIPILPRLSTFASLGAGPSYTDYSFDTPAGAHFAAKRLGAKGELSVGLRYSGLELAATYHAMTRPADIDFDGVQLSLTWIVVRF